MDSPLAMPARHKRLTLRAAVYSILTYGAFALICRVRRGSARGGWYRSSRLRRSTWK